MTEQTFGPDERIAAIDIDSHGVVRYQAAIEAERAKAVEDLLAGNQFHLIAADDLSGPYYLRLSRNEDRLVFDLAATGTPPGGQPATRIQVSLSPMRRTIRDYFTVCESYIEAGSFARPGRLEAIDAGRKALHNEGAQALRDRLAGQIEFDHETARRLFTLICIMHIRA